MVSQLNDAVVSRGPREQLQGAYRAVRQQSEALCAPLSPEDCQIQTAPEASPSKWHLAHTSWFFETFLLQEFLPGYREFHPRFGYLFNSYYQQLGEFRSRTTRGDLSRPGLQEVYAYREHVDVHMRQLLERVSDEHWALVLERCEIGLNHEQQHQELILTDIKLNLSANPLLPAYREDLPTSASSEFVEQGWARFSGGIREVGHDGNGFAYDNELPRHRVLLQHFVLATRPVSNAEFLRFVEAGGYQTPALWLADGWATVQRLGWSSPLYWRKIDGQWHEYTLGGLRPLDPLAPVCHVSHYEAAAYACWAGARLPSEAEWEVAASGLPVVVRGNFASGGHLHPLAAVAAQGLQQLYGDVWEHTASAYLPYPGYRAAQGALGEYNGKFMSNQMVLRGGSCATPEGHVRSSYRNYFYPHERWQFQGIRLARDEQ